MTQLIMKLYRIAAETPENHVLKVGNTLLRSFRPLPARLSQESKHVCSSTLAYPTQCQQALLHRSKSSLKTPPTRHPSTAPSTFETEIPSLQLIQPQTSRTAYFRVIGPSFIFVGKHVGVDRQGMLSPAGPTAALCNANASNHHRPFFIPCPTLLETFPNPMLVPCAVVYNCSKNANTLLALKPTAPELPSILAPVRVSVPRSLPLVLHEDLSYGSGNQSGSPTIHRS